MSILEWVIKFQEIRHR